MRKIRLLGIATLFLVWCVNAQTLPQVILTEVYGGGGNSGAVYNQDFVELYNPGADAVALTGWSLQYYTSTGTTPSKSIEFSTDVQILPYQHFLLAASGGEIGAPLPGKDMEAIASLSLSAGKVVLFKTVDKQTLTTIDALVSNVSYVDIIPYGKAAVPVLGTALDKDCSSILSASRKKDSAGKYIYSSNIGSDFELVTPNPVYSGLKTRLDLIQNLAIVRNNKLVLNLSSEVNVQVVGVSGQVAYSENMSAGSHILNLNSGVYVCKIGSFIQKIIIFEN